jgi:predicted MFS family arabinose efflux permease
LIADLYAPAQRATAIAVYSSGIYVGMFVANTVGGDCYKLYGWRTTFVAFGMIGIAFALVAPLVLSEPKREDQTVRREVVARAPSMLETLRALLAAPGFAHLALGAGIKSIAGYGLATWASAFLGRVHGLAPDEAGYWLGRIGIGGAVGTFFGGWLADRLGRRDPRLRLRSAAWATLAALPCLYLFLFASSASVALIAYVPATVLEAVFLGPVFAHSQELAQPAQRATASALLLFAINLIGLGLGPLAVGALSDALEASCGAESLRWSLAVVALTYVWGSWHLLRAASR